jgi:hypothetical protein
MIDEKLPASNIRLIFRDQPLEDAKSLADAKVENTNILYMVYQKSDGTLSHAQHPCSGCASCGSDCHVIVWHHITRTCTNQTQPNPTQPNQRLILVGPDSWEAIDVQFPEIKD